MQIKYNNKVKNGVVFMELETCGFTCKESKALEYLGEPKVFFQKCYGTDEVLIDNRRIRTGFKIRLRFEGNGEAVDAIKNAATCYEEIKQELSKIMDQLLLKFDDVNAEVAFGDGVGFEVGTGIDADIY